MGTFTYLRYSAYCMNLANKLAVRLKKQQQLEVEFV